MPPRRRKAAPPAPPLTFRTAVWPERTCREPVSGEWGLHSCEVVEFHYGPHASWDLVVTVEARARWEQAHPDRVEPAGSDPYV